MSDCSTNSFLVPDYAGGWKKPNEKHQDVTYTNKTETMEPRTLTLEERCQQLEHVAVAMQKCLATHAYDWTQVAEETADYYKEQLEDLGVSVDE